MKPADFFAKYAPDAQRTCHGTGLCASVCLAQAAIESGWGESGLTKRANNFGGIKAGSTWKGKVLVLPTREVIKGKSVVVQAAFRVYDSPADYFTGRLAFLKGLPRYKRLFAADDFVAEAHLFQACGYATDPNYGATLVAVVNRYGLTKYDDVPTR
jgi:flagellum-specific peptidoglycan hydrolase FlgJ